MKCICRQQHPKRVVKKHTTKLIRDVTRQIASIQITIDAVSLSMKAFAATAAIFANRMGTE